MKWVQICSNLPGSSCLQNLQLTPLCSKASSLWSQGCLFCWCAHLSCIQAAYDDVLERLKGQSNELLAALGGSPGCVTLGSADETALSQVRLQSWPHAVDALSLPLQTAAGRQHVPSSNMGSEHLVARTLAGVINILLVDFCPLTCVWCMCPCDCLHTAAQHS